MGHFIGCKRKCWRNSQCVCGQGSAEYLVIVSIVLIVAVVSLTLMGSVFENDTKATQQTLYWKSASPVAITEATADIDEIHINVKNNAPFAFRVTKISSERGEVDSPDTGPLQPGEEKVLSVAYTSLSPAAGCNSGGASANSPCFIELTDFGFKIESDYGEAAIEKTQKGQDLFVRYEKPPSCEGVVCDIGKVCCSSTGKCTILGGHMGTGGCPDLPCGGCYSFPPKICCEETNLCYTPGIIPGYCVDACGGTCGSKEQCCEAAGNKCIAEELVCDACGGICDPDAQYCVVETGKCADI